LQRPGYLHDFAAFWSARPEARKIWFSLFTPQLGQASQERLSPSDREFAIRELSPLASAFPKVQLARQILDGYRHPPTGPDDCLFAQVTTCIAADLATEITPCELGGQPDCSQCGCMASAGLAAIGRFRLAGLVPLQGLFYLSKQIGETQRRRRREADGQSRLAAD
jgi:hypothetical protein